MNRCLGLILLGFVVYHLDGKVPEVGGPARARLVGLPRQSFWQSPFQTLVHIARRRRCGSCR